MILFMEMVFVIIVLLIICDTVKKVNKAIQDRIFNGFIIKNCSPEKIESMNEMAKRTENKHD